MTPPPPQKGDERNGIQVPHWYLLHRVESWVAIRAQLLKEFPTFYATQIFISAFTSVCHWTLLRQRNTAEFITFKILKIYFNITLHLWLSPSKWSLPYRLIKILCGLLTFPVHITDSANFILLDLFTWTIFGQQCILLHTIFHSLITSPLLGSNTLLSTLVSNIPNTCSTLSLQDQF